MTLTVQKFIQTHRAGARESHIVRLEEHIFKSRTTVYGVPHISSFLNLLSSLHERY